MKGLECLEYSKSFPFPPDRNGKIPWVKGASLQQAAMVNSEQGRGNPGGLYPKFSMSSVPMSCMGPLWASLGHPPSLVHGVHLLLDPDCIPCRAGILSYETG